MKMLNENPYCLGNEKQDIGGQESLRSTWKTYYIDTKVIDGNHVRQTAEN